VRGALIFLFVASVLSVALIESFGYVALHPQHFAWTRLNLEHPIGRATGRKLASLTGNPRRCRALLAAIGDGDRPVSPRTAEPPCGYADGMRLTPEDERSIRYFPATIVTSCPVAAALALWERDVLQPAAIRRFGVPVAIIDHAGSYSCRRIDGRSEGRFSEHATADAFDILGFRLADGRRINVRRDWQRGGREAAFLRDVRDGACRLFSTVLSPDYNAAHADHLHFDQAERGELGFRMCD
jgi:hypothetical protein